MRQKKIVVNKISFFVCPSLSGGGAKVCAFDPACSAYYIGTKAKINEDRQYLYSVWPDKLREG